MQFLDLPGWRIRYDKAATEAVYSNIPCGGAESCTCDACRNWTLTLSDIVPSEFVGLLATLGVPLNRDSEVYHYGQIEPGKHFYGGWYHIVGAVEHGEQEGSPLVEFSSFRFFFHSSPALLPKVFANLPVVQLEFEAQVPWLSAIPEPE